MKIRILDPAIEDIAKARIFYDHQALGLGAYFMDSIFGEIDSLVLYAGVHSIRHDYHRLVVRKFPFAVYCNLENEMAVVYRILDCRRDPVWIQKQLTG
ncbi:MAG: type II toxin-antitoxin system RelE/ParE family toxin [Verrucomicrobiae bacterium]|nr:type II toxin-antitoxin system RelE/ParE family toxin [Verrucomicrobiae bacterium]